MPGRSVLLWIERGLLTAGAGLTIWCLAVVFQAWLVDRARPAQPVKVTSEVVGAERHEAPAPEQGAWLGRIEAPSLKLSAPILEGSDDGTLRKGAGHIEETAFPGQAGNVGIAGHRDTIFRPLRRVHVGDVLTVETPDHSYEYRVHETLIVGPEDVSVLDGTPQPTLTLVTCYPFEFIGHAPRRFIVRADLVDEVAKAAEGTRFEGPGRHLRGRAERTHQK